MLDRIAPVPSFLQNEQISVAIKNSSSDIALITCLHEICDALTIREKVQLEKVMLICDADEKMACDKKEYLLQAAQYTEDFQICRQNNEMNLELSLSNDRKIVIPMMMYAFPNDDNKGTLEDVLLETAEQSFPELLEPAEIYVDSIDSQIYTELAHSAKRKKAIVGCIGNILRPGKANQVAISDSEWISPKSMECTGVKQLATIMREFVDLQV